MSNFNPHSLEPFWESWYIDSLIGEGSYGSVYKIYKEEFGRRYYSALKIISLPKTEGEEKEVLAESTDIGTATQYFYEVAEGIYKEIQIMEELKGRTNIVSFEDHKIIPKETGIGYYIIIRMELLTSLNDYLQEEGLTSSMLLKLGKDLSTALEICQKRNIIHRDIKPANIFVSSDGDFKLGDFGIARQLEGVESALSVKGTYGYMAPEVYRGELYDERVDIYSLGMVMYYYLNNRRAPFMPTDTTALRFREKQEALRRRFHGEPLPTTKWGQKELVDCVLTACQFKAEDRYSTAEEFYKALDAVTITMDEVLIEQGALLGDGAIQESQSKQSGSISEIHHKQERVIEGTTNQGLGYGSEQEEISAFDSVSQETDEDEDGTVYLRAGSKNRKQHRSMIGKHRGCKKDKRVQPEPIKQEDEYEATVYLKQRIVEDPTEDRETKSEIIGSGEMPGELELSSTEDIAEENPSFELKLDDASIQETEKELESAEVIEAGQELESGQKFGSDEKLEVAEEIEVSQKSESNQESGITEEIESDQEFRLGEKSETTDEIEVGQESEANQNLESVKESETAEEMEIDQESGLSERSEEGQVLETDEEYDSDAEIGLASVSDSSEEFELASEELKESEELEELESQEPDRELDLDKTVVIQEANQDNHQNELDQSGLLEQSDERKKKSRKVVIWVAIPVVVSAIAIVCVSGWMNRSSKPVDINVEVTPTVTEQATPELRDETGEGTGNTTVDESEDVTEDGIDNGCAGEATDDANSTIQEDNTDENGEESSDGESQAAVDGQDAEQETSTNEESSTEEIADYEVDLSGKKLKNYESIEDMQKLTSLIMQNNKLTETSQLSEAVNLTYLDLSGNKITKLSGITDLTKLICLNLQDNKVEEVSNLGNLTELKILILSENDIKDINDLKGLTELTEIRVDHNSELSDISVVKNFKELQIVDLSNTAVDDISALYKLEDLLVVNVSNTNVPESQIKKLKKSVPGCTVSD